MQNKLTTARNIVLGVVIGMLVGFTAWSINRARAFGEVEGRVHFGIVTILPATQNARLNFVVVEPDDSGVDMQPCIFEVRTFDALGRAYGTPDTFQLRPGIAVSRNVIPAGTSIEGTFQFRTTVRIVEDPNIRTRCEVIPTMEVYSRETGLTQLMNPAVVRGFNPQPDPPGQN